MVSSRPALMPYDDFPEPLRQWIDQCLAAGTSDDAMVSALKTAGYSEQQTVLIREVAAFRRKEFAARHEAVAGLASSDLLAQLPNALQSSDRKVHLLFAMNSPRVVLFGDLLDTAECDALVEASRGKLERSTVLNPATGERDVELARTSSGTFFRRGEHPLVTVIEQRIAELTGHPVAHGEPLQILHYLPGAEYKPHYDWFDPDQPGNQAVLAQGGQRVATVVMYLNDVEAGGSTVFPQVGLDVLPRKGNAVFFAYKNPGEAPDARSLHGGTPVAAGEKWIATKWIRERPYQG